MSVIKASPKVSLPDKQKDQDTPAPPSLKAVFRVVGIGASAGGLDAVSALLQSLSPDTGMAFVFVQHLAPSHTSMLTEILSKKTAMPVAEATEGQQIEPNHVYVIPPNTTMIIAQGRLHLTPRNDALRIPTPIDDFFQSLAEERGPQAIGISLSGAGTDGALGMQSIKNEGGITFAQDKTSAQYSSMPCAAVELGCIDFILSPPEISEELMRISLHVPGEEDGSQGRVFPDSEEADLQRIFQLLHENCNLDFTHYKRGTIKRRLARRLALQNLHSLADYMLLLDYHPEELKALCGDFLIHVTSFFRDPDTFDNLAKYIFPRIIAGNGENVSLRIWVPGCSTGEEVYSLAICCLEYIREKGLGAQIQIFGTDVSDAALQKARAGIYVESIARNVSPERLKKFFVKTGEHYQVAKSVREICIFSRHDVTSDPPFSRLDLISCRNLLIYFNPLVQKRVIPSFNYALKAGGILILGPAENISGFSDIFTPTDNKQIKFYIKESLPEKSQLKYLEGFAAKSAPFPSYPLSHALSHPDVLKGKYPGIDERKWASGRITQVMLDRYVPAAVICDKDLNILEFRGDTGPYLVQPSGPPDTSLQKLARPGLIVEINKAVQQAGKDNAPVRKSGLRIDTFDGHRDIALDVVPIRNFATDEPYFLIFFEDQARFSSLAAEKPGFWRALGALVMRQGRKDALRPADTDELSRLRQELDDTRDYIRAIMDEYETTKEGLQSAQEELLSSNEEFQSTNEELETTKEELQSANEELLTTNEGVHHRNRELNELNEKSKLALNYAEAVLNTAHQPFLVLDGNLHILRANPAFYRAFKTTPETTEGRLLYDLGDRQWDIPELHHFLQALLLEDTSFKDCEITHAFPGVGTKTMRLNGTNLIGGQQLKILLAIEDVSDYRTALNTLKDNDRHKDEFLAMLAHELRNPLAPICNALEIWKSGNAGEAAEKKSQIIMARQLQTMLRLVDDLLDVARITRGVVVLEADAVNLVKLIRQTVEGARHHFEARHHVLSSSLPEGSVYVRGDAIRLEQIISNLLINAAKYTNPGGRISVVLECVTGVANIRVIDNGVGISSELLPYIFDLFVQEERSLDRKQGGLGLGLTLVRRLVELQGGTVEVKSEGLKQGSEFIVRLPLINVVEAGIPAAVLFELDNEKVAGRRILIIDDNVDAALTTQTLLELRGHDVRTAIDGPSGIAAALAFTPDVILLDIGLPGMDGYEVARRFRALDETKEILLIALSGYGQKGDIQKSEESGFDYHLVKPADTNQLQALILTSGLIQKSVAGA